ncbi:MAG TPA: hypothetical protein VGA40_00530 [Candidatus Acidoferrales bacterium]
MTGRLYQRGILLACSLLALVCLGVVVSDSTGTDASPSAAPQPQQSLSRLMGQTKGEAERKSTGCISCHASTDEPTMHPSGTVMLGCTDCHTGDAGVAEAAGVAPGSRDYEQAKRRAHPQPSVPRLWGNAANPVRAYTDWLRESADYIQFVNPGDLRVAQRTCGTAGCHVREVRAVRTSMMTHGGFLWAAALYNNGAFPLKDAHFGESYSEDGQPQRITTQPPPTPEDTKASGILPYLDPLPRWETSQPGNVLRVFERGGRRRPEVGNPTREEEPGRPDAKVSDRGFGTLLRTDPVFLGLQKTRLHDPLLSFPGTNDQPGDYRGSGCTGCHVVYANDRSPVHSGPYAQYGNEGHSATVDPTIPKNVSGHPIRHTFTRSIPSSQCMICHIHPGTNMVTTYFGYTWWDNETDGKAMYPARQRYPSERERQEVRLRNPEGAAVRGLWSDVEFLKQVGTPEFNKKLEHTQFADFHGHGWIFRAVHKRDRKGNLLDKDGQVVSFDDPDKFSKAVHLKDIHLERGMHCIDCHFNQDNHGNTKIYNEPRAAIEIDCIDCHGTVDREATLVTSGPAAPPGGTPLEILRTPWRERRFYRRDGKLFQRSMVEEGKHWELVQVRDTVTPGHPRYNEQSSYAKTIRRDGATWGSAPESHAQLAHSNEKMTCYSCHTSWTTSCFGCHLSMTANNKMPMQHTEGLTTRNWTSYNFQVLRDDVYMLGKDGSVTGNRTAPVRSACAILVSSQNQNREWLYYAQQTVSSEGLSGQAFSTYVPHTVRSRETKQCSDCHVSATGDNNAWMAQILVQGTNLVNYIGRFAYVATGKKGFEAVVVAEREEPAAVIGSDLHKLAYPDWYGRHTRRGKKLAESYHHAGNVLDVQARGEYLYAALGEGGFRAYDIANIDHKGFSERIVTAPVSPLGQRLYVPTKYATGVATPTTLGVDPLRTRDPANEEQSIHLIYGFLYVADKYEGLVVIGDPDLNTKDPAGPGVGTLLDGDPTNNFLKRALPFNPGGILNGARRITIAGTFAYILCDRGLVVVDLDNPLAPRVVAEIGAPELNEPRGIRVQFRYAFVVDREGLKVLDVTDLSKPRVVPGARVPFDDARNIYLARTYAYVAGGRQGLAIVDIERPEQPRLDQVFNADGHINDTNDVKIGMVSASAFAFLADGKNGLQVVQLFSPEDNPHHYGFSPRPTPKLIAHYHTHAPALAVSEGIQRDRAVDESGNQLAVFGRRGARPFNKEEQQRLYLREGKLYTVTDTPPNPPPQPSRARAWLDAILDRWRSR